MQRQRGCEFGALATAGMQGRGCVSTATPGCYILPACMPQQLGQGWAPAACHSSAPCAHAGRPSPLLHCLPAPAVCRSTMMPRWWSWGQVIRTLRSRAGSSASASPPACWPPTAAAWRRCRRRRPAAAGARDAAKGACRAGYMGLEASCLQGCCGTHQHPSLCPPCVQARPRARPRPAAAVRPRRQRLAGRPVLSEAAGARQRRLCVSGGVGVGGGGGVPD